MGRMSDLWIEERNASLDELALSADYVNESVKLHNTTYTDVVPEFVFGGTVKAVEATTADWGEELHTTYKNAKHPKPYPYDPQVGFSWDGDV